MNLANTNPFLSVNTFQAVHCICWPIWVSVPALICLFSTPSWACSSVRCLSASLIELLHQAVWRCYVTPSRSLSVITAVMDQGIWAPGLHWACPLFHCLPWLPSPCCFLQDKVQMNVSGQHWENGTYCTLMGFFVWPPTISGHFVIEMCLVFLGCI